MGYVKLLFFMLFSFICQPAFSSHLCPKHEALALLQFNHMFTINASASDYCVSSTPKTLSWNKSIDCCSWDGVYCDETTGQVIELNLTCSRLQGKFHSNSSLFQLSNLKRLDLSINNFSGSFISPKFGELSSLTHLDLSYSSFTGVIPAEISHLSKLHVLRIWSSDLRFGPHNFEVLLKNLTQLRVLNLDFVNISSTFPLNFSSFLTTLFLEDTKLYGILPERVFHLSNLESLVLSYSPQLTVRFPTTKWNRSASLRTMGIYSCNLSGSIPKPLWNLTNIEVMILEDNHLEGSISDFFRFGKLKLIYLGNNNFDGQLEFSSINTSWTQLESLDFSFNFLTGPIPSNVSGLQNLHELYLLSNHLNGTIPSWIFSLPSLTDLNLGDNHFSRQIASTICNLKTLEVLHLGSNHLEGTIPLCLGEMSKLRVLDLSNNSLSGTINTFSIGNQLKVIKFDGNKLEGKVPQSLINCKYLKFLDLANNELSDTFPKWLGALPELHGPNK